SKAKKLWTSVPVAPSNTLTWGRDPGPDPTTTSSTPSPVTSPVATLTPPAKPGKGLRSKRRLPSALYTLTSAAPAPVPTANSSTTPLPPPTGGGGAVTASAAENSEVLFSRNSLAVADRSWPTGTGVAGVRVKEALPCASVVTAVAPRNRCPSPNPD